jgi:hypothetical protein
VVGEGEGRCGVDVGAANFGDGFGEGVGDVVVSGVNDKGVGCTIVAEGVVVGVGVARTSVHCHSVPVNPPICCNNAAQRSCQWFKFGGADGFSAVPGKTR